MLSVYICCRYFLWVGYFRIRLFFPKAWIPVYLLLISFYSVEEPVFHRWTLYAIMTWYFPIRYFLECCSRWFLVNVHLRIFLSPHKHSIYFIHPFRLSIILFLFQYFTLKLFCFLCIHLLIYHRVFSTYLMVGFSLSCFVCIAWPCPSIFLVTILR